MKIFTAQLSQSLWNRAMSFDVAENCYALVEESQSLWNRAMSFDFNPSGHPFVTVVSQSLWNRAMSFDCSGMLEAGVMRPFRPTSQFFWKVKELALNLSK